jgi:hypothetical protein
VQGLCLRRVSWVGVRTVLRDNVRLDCMHPLQCSDEGTKHCFCLLLPAGSTGDPNAPQFIVENRAVTLEYAREGDRSRGTDRDGGPGGSRRPIKTDWLCESVSPLVVTACIETARIEFTSRNSAAPLAEHDELFGAGLTFCFFCCSFPACSAAATTSRGGTPVSAATRPARSARSACPQPRRPRTAAGTLIWTRYSVQRWHVSFLYVTYPSFRAMVSQATASPSNFLVVKGLSPLIQEEQVYYLSF